MLPKLQDVPKQIILLRMRNGYSVFRGFASLGKGRCLSNCPNGYKKEMNPAGGYKKLMLEVGDLARRPRTKHSRGEIKPLSLGAKGV